MSQNEKTKGNPPADAGVEASAGRGGAPRYHAGGVLVLARDGILEAIIECLTGIITGARARGFSCALVCGEEAELLRVNSRAELWRAARAFQDRLRERAGPRSARHGPLGKTLALRRT